MDREVQRAPAPALGAANQVRTPRPPAHLDRDLRAASRGQSPPLRARQLLPKTHECCIAPESANPALDRVPVWVTGVQVEAEAEVARAKEAAVDRARVPPPRPLANRPSRPIEDPHFGSFSGLLRALRMHLCPPPARADRHRPLHQANQTRLLPLARMLAQLQGPLRARVEVTMEAHHLVHSLLSLRNASPGRPMRHLTPKLDPARVPVALDLVVPRVVRDRGAPREVLVRALDPVALWSLLAQPLGPVPRPASPLHGTCIRLTILPLPRLHPEAPRTKPRTHLLLLSSH